MSIRIQGLSVRYPGASAPVVTDLDLEVAEGELLTLLGPSGSGKSTTIRCVAGLERPVAGAISVDGEVVCDLDRGFWIPPEKRRLGMVFQSYAVWPHLSVFENIAFPLASRGDSRKAQAPRVERIAELVGLSDFLGRSATQLSGGQQQRVALARALVAEPRAILFDEPLSNLDAKLRERMRRELRRLQQETGITAIYVTHDQAEAFAISDRVAVMENGRIAQIGIPSDIYDRPASRYVADFVGAANILDAEVRHADGAASAHLADLGLSVPLPAGRAEGPVAVAIRPEHVALCPADEPGAVRAVVEDSEYLGNCRLVWLRAAGTVLRAQVGAAQHCVPGQEVGIRISPNAAIHLGGE